MPSVLNVQMEKMNADKSGIDFGKVSITIGGQSLGNFLRKNKLFFNSFCSTKTLESGVLQVSSSDRQADDEQIQNSMVLALTKWKFCLPASSRQNIVFFKQPNDPNLMISLDRMIELVKKRFNSVLTNEQTPAAETNGKSIDFTADANQILSSELEVAHSDHKISATLNLKSAMTNLFDRYQK